MTEPVGGKSLRGEFVARVHLEDAFEMPDGCFR
jgi:hypothetical protein